MKSDHFQPETWALVTPADLLRSITRRLPSVLFTTASVTLLVGCLLVAWPNQFASDGLFYARLGRGAVAMDPTTEPGRSVSFQESRSSEVTSISRMLNSREIMDRVVNKVGVDQINRPRNWIERLTAMAGALTKDRSTADHPSGGTQDQTLENDRHNEDQIAHEEAVEKVASSLAINVPKDSYTISVSAKGSDPFLVQDIVQAVMDQYGSLHVAAHQSVGSLEFFEKQCAESRQDAVDAVTKLQQTRQAMGWMSTKSAEKILQERMVELEASLDKARSALADAQSRTKSLARQLENIEPWVPTETMQVANEAVDLMRSQLYEAQLQDGERLAKLTSNHPRYRRLRQKIDSGTKIVESIGNDREERTNAVNPVRIELETQQEIALTELAGLRSRYDSIRESLQGARDDAKRLAKDTILLSELAWKADVAEKTYLDHAERLESTRVIHELDQREMSDMSVIQNASLNLKKVGPPRLLLIGLGGMLGMCLGILQALVRDSPVGSPTATAAKSFQRQQDGDQGYRPAGDRGETAYHSDTAVDRVSEKTATAADTGAADTGERVSVPR